MTVRVARTRSAGTGERVIIAVLVPVTGDAESDEVRLIGRTMVGPPTPMVDVVDPMCAVFGGAPAVLGDPDSMALFRRGLPGPTSHVQHLSVRRDPVHENRCQVGS